MHNSTDDTLETLDEIDIDSILSESIGTSGKPTVPSAHQTLPALLESDIVDIESLLQEFGSLNDDGTPELSLTDTLDLLRPSDSELENTLNESDATAIIVDIEPITITAESPLQEEEIFLETHLLTIPDDIELTITDAATIPQESAKLVLSELLVQEAPEMQIGPLPIPDHPDALPASTTRKFWTRPRRPLTLQQKRAYTYATGVLLWSLVASHMAWKSYHHHIAFMHPPVPPTPAIKKIKINTVKSPPAPPIPVKELKKAPPPKQGSASSKQEEVAPPLDGAQKKTSSDYFKPIQCNISMDSKTLREDLRKCLRSARIAN